MKKYLVNPTKPIKLVDFDPNDTSGFEGDKAAAKAALLELTTELDALQELLYAEHKRKLLVVIQAMDTGGKDGTIRGVFEGVNPQGIHVASFKVPTPIELDHDYLWRVHQQIPGKGEIVIFNRSHYEDLLVVRVHNLVPKMVWSKRFKQICEFERMLSEEGVTILKFYLHIDQVEQQKRLLARLGDPTRRWKFNPGDLEERKLWPGYMKVYEDVLNKTSTNWAPWYIVPANHKYYRNLVVATIIRDTLKNFKMSYPDSFTEEEINKYQQALIPQE